MAGFYPLGGCMTFHYAGYHMSVCPLIDSWLLYGVMPYTWGVQMSWCDSFGGVSRAGSLDHVVFLLPQDGSACCFLRAELTHVPPTVPQLSPFFTFSPASVVVFDESFYLAWRLYLVVLICISSLVIWSIFSCNPWPSVHLRNIYVDPIFNWTVLSFLYTMDINLHQRNHLQISFLILKIAFSLWLFPTLCRIIFDRIQFVYFYSCCLCFWIPVKILFTPVSQSDSSGFLQ